MESVVNQMLRFDGAQGWKLDLFVNIDKAFICALCANVCRDCVELSCDVEHSDQDFEVYCESCLKALLDSNGNLCPINKHADPSYSISRSSRGRILKSMVLCPNSSQYQQSLKSAKSASAASSSDDAKDDEEEEGPAIAVEAEAAANNNSNNNSSSAGSSASASSTDCAFSGTLAALLKTHIDGCCERTTMSDANMQVTVMKRIKTEVQELEARVAKVEKNQAQTANGIEVNLGSIKVKNDKKLQLKEEELSAIRDKVQNSRSMRATLENRLKQQNREINNLKNSIFAFKNQFNEYKVLHTQAIENIAAGKNTYYNTFKFGKNTSSSKNNSNSDNNGTRFGGGGSTEPGFTAYKGKFVDENHGSKIAVIDGNRVLMNGYVSSIRLSQGIAVSDRKKYLWYFKIDSTSKQNGYHFMGVCSNIASSFGNTPFDGLKDCYGVSGNPANVFQGAKTVTVTDFGESVIGKVIRLEYDGQTKKLLFKFAEDNNRLIYTMQLPTRAEITTWYPCLGIANSGDKGFFWENWALSGGGSSGGSNHFESNILTTTALMRKLAEWCPRPARFKLLHRATRDGWTAANFHTHCDAAAKTVTVMTVANGNIFGGYTAKPWDKANGGWITDEHAFCFLLKSESNPELCGKFKITSSGTAIYANSSYGANFGNVDLEMKSTADIKIGVDSGGSYACPKNSKAFAGTTCTMVTLKNFEVFEVTSS